MYVNAVFVIRCLYSALYELFLLLLVIIKEQVKLNVQCTVWFLVTWGIFHISAQASTGINITSLEENRTTRDHLDF